jgi:hypothetical protein
VRRAAPGRRYSRDGGKDWLAGAGVGLCSCGPSRPGGPEECQDNGLRAQAAAVPIPGRQRIAARAAPSERELQARPGEQEWEGLGGPDLCLHDCGSPANRIRLEAVDDGFSLIGEEGALGRADGRLRSVSQLAVARWHEHHAASSERPDEFCRAHPTVPQSSAAGVMGCAVLPRRVLETRSTNDVGTACGELAHRSQTQPAATRRCADWWAP